MSPAKAVKPDSVAVQSVEAARDALLESVPSLDVGEHLGHRVELDRVVTHLFECRRAGYRGWRWNVTVARAARAKTVTVDEVVLLPGEDAIVAPVWVPYRERIQPGDLSPGDLLPTDDDDPRLVPGYLLGDTRHVEDDTDVEHSAWDLEDDSAVREVVREVGLGRERVLSLEGREQAAQRWYDGERGPEAAIAQSAKDHCSSCGFLVRIAGPLSRVFGVCANAYANDDGQVVSFDHGCGAHSRVQLGKQSQPQPLPEPAVDTLSWEDLERF